MDRMGTQEIRMTHPLSTSPNRPRPKAVDGSHLASADDDAELLEALKQGDPQAKCRLFDRFERRSRGLIVSVLGPDAEIADVLHDVFVNVFGSVHTLRNAGALRFWVDRVTILTVRKALRARKRRSWLRLFRTEEEEMQHEPMGEVDPEAQAALRAAYSILEKMPLDERVFFGLRFVDGMELTEVAAACKVSLSTAKRRIYQAQAHFGALAQNRPELHQWLRGEEP